MKEGFVCHQRAQHKDDAVIYQSGEQYELNSIGFAAFGRVIQGMDFAARMYAGYGQQPQQNLIESQGNAYLQQNFPNLDYIKTARVE